ncbi:sulfite reductase subunit alpha [Neobacillus thermocopriae]|uniref:assimilatory sulfite reductase (NADPH) n=1 Tax=Neobacillus thermocopriae TaxID=1215031 RepID=A0A6B3TTT2_9BACI|nr:sulfite reductase subunit alpha [Neobacillus thermocopriae]MED3623803.1 sulfite reductase subunit alpha [Neobacillus thermocopriae]MED3712988.1 sulfite reductase subunit alpha [Neobacillus thermocopriae]NEX79077.1 sulfite reductase subunit alpha [Neobacillus thermocopriae]
MQMTADNPKITKSAYSRTNPFQAKILKNINLNGSGSNKETRHLELSLKGSGLSYKPGDALGIVPSNDPELVASLIEEMGWDEETIVTVGKQGETMSLKEALTNHYEITLLTKKILQQAASFTENEELKSLVLAEHADKLKDYCYGRDLLDMLRDFGPWKASAQEIVSLLRKMPPRLYSIASSMAAHPDEVHLTIGAVRYNAHGRDRKGVCSVLCAERVQEGDTLPVFVQPNKHFHLPESDDKDIIMVGPGTGIAPFRSFIEERAVNKATGRMWLFYGDQHKATDFLYQEELEKYQQDGVLTKIDTAFSRDSEQKVYVQHRMIEHSKELFEWIEKGAYFYVCGDKEHMAKDVHETLITIIEKEGAMPRDAAEAYLKEMQKQGRYQRDVY